jgi:hypothetical protein
MVSVTETAPARRAPPEGPRFGLATATFVIVSCMIRTMNRGTDRETPMVMAASPR